MTKHDRIIADLMAALAMVERHTKSDTPSFAYIQGLAHQAQVNCDAYRVRNSDGYLVVKHEE